MSPAATIVARRAPEPDWLGAGNEARYTHVRTFRALRAVVVKDFDDPAPGSLSDEVHATIFAALGRPGREETESHRPRRI